MFKQLFENQLKPFLLSTLSTKDRERLKNFYSFINPSFKKLQEEDEAWYQQRMSLQYSDLTDANYQKFKHLRSAEHCIGRIIKLEQIIKDIAERKLEGDFLEFGSYQGEFIVWLARFRKKYGLEHKKIIGIDSFEGLPCDSNGWTKGMFNDTSTDFVRQNLDSHLNDDEKQNIELIKGWFSDPSVKEKLYNLSADACLINFDADLKVSTEQAFAVVEPLLTKAKQIYFLFDDWGCHPDEVPPAFEQWKKDHPKFTVNLFSETNLTKYFFLST